MNDTMEAPAADWPAVDPAPIRTDVAVAAAGAIDLKKIDLTAVALAQFGDWRAATAKLKADNTKTVLDLSTQSKIDDAISLRQRTVKQPLADARRVEKALKSKLSEASKAVGAELVLLEAAYADASVPMTTQIDAAQARIDAAKEAIRQAEIARLAALREAVTTALAAWAERCREDGITAERIGRGVDMLEQLEPDAAWAEVDAYWQSAKAQTLATMRGLQAAAQQREDAARIEAQRIENERIAAENARIAAEAAAESARVAAAAAAEKAAAEALMEQARQMLAEAAAAEAKRFADQETERAAEAAQAQAAAEAATIKPNAQSEEGALKPADVPATQEADAPLGMCASSEAQAAQASPSGDEGTGAHAEERAPNPALWAVHVEGPDDIEAAPSKEAAQTRADSLNQWAAEKRLADVCIQFNAKVVPWSFSEEAHAEDLRKMGYEPDTTSEAAPQQAGVQFLSNELDIAKAGYSHEADTAPATISDTIRDRALDLQALAAEARASRFPRQPKMTPEWWAALYAAVDSLAAEVA